MTDPKQIIAEFLKAIGYPAVKKCTIHCNWENNSPILIDIEALVTEKGEVLKPLVECSAALEVKKVYEFRGEKEDD